MIHQYSFVPIVTGVLRSTPKNSILNLAQVTESNILRPKHYLIFTADLLILCLL
ncbi:protein of unknown function [Xenorhabdus poinarii G6]|uniref:Uncharacterized protein n=1 Tax=Xenorhabdus poinarii G6 TaxID=1354304 RepID=A0A068R3D7_9GAMM|nr:protein of unknown function [Xenorhabdus poinarii G6]